MAGTRFLAAGLLLYIYMRWIKGERAPRESLRPAFIMGGLLLLGGNGGVVIAAQYVPSGITALLVGAGPFWFVLLGWLWLRGPRPGLMAVAGLILGFMGLVVLIGPGQITGSAGATPIWPALLVVAAALSWSVGSIYSKTLKVQASPMMMSALQMLAGFVLLMGAGFVRGEHVGFHPGAITWQSWIAWGYLVIVGSLIGFSAYIYVLRHATPAVASTYAYVNPMVAVFFGWAFGGEPLTREILIAAPMIVGAVILISWPRAKKPDELPAEPEHD